MKCRNCGLDVKLCDNCSWEFRNQDDVVHYVIRYGKDKGVYHICQDCLNDIMTDEEESE